MDQSTHVRLEVNATRTPWRAIPSDEGLSVLATGLLAKLAAAAYCEGIHSYRPLRMSLRTMAARWHLGVRTITRLLQELAAAGYLDLVQAARGALPGQLRLTPLGGQPEASRPSLRARVLGFLSAALSPDNAPGPSVANRPQGAPPPDPRARTGEIQRQERETAPPGVRAHPTGARTASGAYDEPPRAIPAAVQRAHADTLARLRGLEPPEPATRLH